MTSTWCSPRMPPAGCSTTASTAGAHAPTPLSTAETGPNARQIRDQSPLGSGASVGKPITEARGVGRRPAGPDRGRARSGAKRSSRPMNTVSSAARSSALSLKPADAVSTAPVVAAGLIGGWLIARETGIRPLGGVALGAAGLYAGRTWLARRGAATTAVLGATYVLGFGLSHPLAKKIGAWPAVLTVTGVAAGAAAVLSDAAYGEWTPAAPQD